jgi:hypothetical protein
MGTEADIIATPISHRFLPLPLIFGGAACRPEENEERH